MVTINNAHDGKTGILDLRNPCSLYFLLSEDNSLYKLEIVLQTSNFSSVTYLLYLVYYCERTKASHVFFGFYGNFCNAPFFLAHPI